MKASMGLLLVAIMAFATSGCSVRLPEASIDIGYPGGHGGHHCPPGQAKKGNC